MTFVLCFVCRRWLFFTHRSWFCRMLKSFFLPLCLRSTHSTVTAGGFHRAQHCVLNNGVQSEWETAREKALKHCRARMHDPFGRSPQCHVHLVVKFISFLRDVICDLSCFRVYDFPVMSVSFYVVISLSPLTCHGDSLHKHNIRNSVWVLMSMRPMKKSPYIVLLQTQLIDSFHTTNSRIIRRTFTLSQFA